ncbi:hypothetical protein AAIR98_001851 [Elusimicrobium simillimum]|uniref:hypothetical protein n=1 Tax=Elusimicrobium simillimum TaxID=3143438 RepID=UPI003C6F786D
MKKIIIPLSAFLLFACNPLQTYKPDMDKLVTFETGGQAMAEEGRTQPYIAIYTKDDKKLIYVAEKHYDMASLQMIQHSFDTYAPK